MEKASRESRHVGAAFADDYIYFVDGEPCFTSYFEIDIAWTRGHILIGVSMIQSWFTVQCIMCNGQKEGSALWHLRVVHYSTIIPINRSEVKVQHHRRDVDAI